MDANRSSNHAVPRVLLVCSGLDHAYRGFESFARECFDALRGDPGVDIQLVKGSGPDRPSETSVSTLRRDRALARSLGRVLRARPFRIEAFAFAFAVAPLIARRRPDVVFLSEWDTARVLARIRSLTGLKFKLLLSNGTLAWTGFEHLDRVQELTPAARQYVIERGDDPQRHTLLPLGFDIDPEFTPLSEAHKTALRERLGLPANRTIIVSVAALNRHHKRLDYVIEEVASMPEPRPFLLLLGQREEETAGLLTLARERLGESHHSVRTVPPSEVADLCRASDAFVLASVYEGLPRALIEASALGLPCLVHDYPVSAYALGPHRHGADLREPGALAGLISALTDDDLSAQRAAARHAYAYEHFSWDRLRGAYVELLREVAFAPAVTGSAGWSSARPKLSRE